jgi:hypothetical protein
LQAENKKQKKKRVKRRSYIAYRSMLTVAEGLQLVQDIENKQQSSIEEGPSNTKKRVLPKYSICKSEKHNARTCQYK